MMACVIVVELHCMLICAALRLSLCWHDTLQALMIPHLSPLQRPEKACLQKIFCICDNM